MDLYEIVSLIVASHKDQAEYELTGLILHNLLTGKRFLSKDEMYDLYMRNRDKISKASFYRILTRLKNRGMVIEDSETKNYQVSIHFANALQKLAIAWTSIIEKK
jgi:Fe2+ or Zn2+ uptake regulation protein